LEVAFPFAAALAVIPLAKIIATASTASLAGERLVRLFDRLKNTSGKREPSGHQDTATILAELEKTVSQHEEIISNQAEAINQLTELNQGLSGAVRVLEARSKLLALALVLALILAIAALLAALLM
jgi:hypothetical protein